MKSFLRLIKQYWPRWLRPLSLLAASYFWRSWRSSRGFTSTIHVHVLLYVVVIFPGCAGFKRHTWMITSPLFWHCWPWWFFSFILFFFFFSGSFITPKQYCSVILSYSETSRIILCVICNTTWPQIWCQVRIIFLLLTTLSFKKLHLMIVFTVREEKERLMAYLCTAIFHDEMEWHNHGLNKLKLRNLLITFYKQIVFLFTVYLFF